MRLKYRYAAFLLFTLLLLVLAGLLSVYFLQQKLYYATLLIFVLLYFSTFLLGRKFSKIFFVLSTLRFLRKKQGILSLTEYSTFIDKLLGNRRTLTMKEELKEEILQTLERENEIAIQDDKIVLLTPI